MSRQFAAHVEDLLRPLGAVTVKRMFGGGGVMLDGAMFALIADDILYFKADDATSAPYRAEGMEPFQYRVKGALRCLPYWRAPDRLFDDADELLALAKAANAVAQRRKAARGKR